MPSRRLAELRDRLLYVVDDGPLRAISLTTAKGLWLRFMRGEPLPADTADKVAEPIATIGPDESLLEVGEKRSWRAIACS